MACGAGRARAWPCGRRGPSKPPSKRPRSGRETTSWATLHSVIDSMTTPSGPRTPMDFPRHPGRAKSTCLGLAAEVPSQSRRGADDGAPRHSIPPPHPAAVPRQAAVSATPARCECARGRYVALLRSAGGRPSRLAATTRRRGQSRRRTASHASRSTAHWPPEAGSSRRCHPARAKSGAQGPRPGAGQDIRPQVEVRRHARRARGPQQPSKALLRWED